MMAGSVVIGTLVILSIQYSKGKYAMPTTHYASRQFLEQKGLDIDWRIDITNQKKKRKINGDIPLNLKRVSDEVIWVRDGGEHPVYILQVEDGASDDSDDDMVWVQR